MTLPRIEGRLATLRPPRDEDADPLLRIVGEPETRPWWGPHSLEDVRRSQVESDHGWVIEVAGEPAGWVQYHEETDPRFRYANLDLYVTAGLHGLGHGLEALRLAIGHLVDLGHHRFTIDPAAANERAIAAYAKVGFRPVGTLRRYERIDGGGWRDGLLMELLAEEFVS